MERSLTPVTLDATHGVTLNAVPNGSVLASGANPPATIYTVTAPATLPRITAVRLEALPDPSLPKGGPGRDVYGNFQVNGLEIAGRADAFSPSKVRAVKADDSAGGSGNLDSFFPKIAPRDGSGPEGWRIDATRDDTRLPRQIVFTLDRPLDMAPRRRNCASC